MKVEEIQELLMMAEQFKPLAGYVEQIADMYGPTIYQLVEKIVLGSCDLKIAAFKQYKETGLFTNEQCFNMVGETFKSISNSLENINRRNQ